jgi:hypothetical protein
MTKRNASNRLSALIPRESQRIRPPNEIPYSLRSRDASNVDANNNNLNSNSLNENSELIETSTVSTNTNTSNTQPILTQPSVSNQSNNNGSISNMNDNSNSETNAIQSACESNTNTLNEHNDEYEYSVNEMLALAKANEYPKKCIKIGEKKKYYTPVLHFFLNQYHFRTKPKDSIKFKCKICDIELLSKIGDASNLNKHLIHHNQSNEWYQLFKKTKKNSSDKIIGDDTFNLVKYFISSNQACLIM